MYPPGPCLDDERDIQALEREHAVDVEQVRSQQRGGAGAQEGAPGLVAVRWRRDTARKSLVRLIAEFSTSAGSLSGRPVALSSSGELL
jgi:hypothetical protein